MWCVYTCVTQMLVEAPEQDVAKGSDIIRQLMGRLTNTMPNNIFVYQTRTINNPAGQPSTSVSRAVAHSSVAASYCHHAEKAARPTSTMCVSSKLLPGCNLSSWQSCAQQCLELGY